MVEWILEDIGHQIDPKQFGCLRGVSTTLCLLDMFHSWLSKLDAGGCSLRIVLLDFCKAFDRINLNVLITKLIDRGYVDLLSLGYVTFCLIANRE